jgi:hypothetical protein
VWLRWRYLSLGKGFEIAVTTELFTHHSEVGSGPTILYKQCQNLPSGVLSQLHHDSQEAGTRGVGHGWGCEAIAIVED